MAEDTARHRPGTPCWVVVVTPDPGRTGEFYADLFGWSEPKPGAGFDTVDCNGSEVAAVLQLPPEAAEAGAASRWLVYLATDDIGASLGKIRGAGGEIVAPAFDVGDLGRMAMAADGTGAHFGLWEAGTHPGADGYITCVLDEVPVAGMLELGAADGQSPSYWMPYFAVVDCDVTASLADGLGGEVCGRPPRRRRPPPGRPPGPARGPLLRRGAQGRRGRLKPNRASVSRSAGGRAAPPSSPRTPRRSSAWPRTAGA